MQQQLKTSDQRTSAATFEEEFQPGVSDQKEANLCSSLKALMYKSFKLQSRNWCSNICQIVTPIICLLFTVFVRIIVEGITTGAVNSYAFPQPFNMPIMNWAVRSQFNLSCQELYYYQGDLSSYQFSQQIIGLQLKDYCPKQDTMNPFFVRKESVNSALMQKLKEADLTAFQRGDDLKTEIPDGMVNFRNSSKNKLIATLYVNDFRLPEYHKNNGVTKVLIKLSQTSLIATYLRVTEGIMSLVDKLTRPYLQMLSRDREQKEIIAGSYMYMPFSGEDTSLIDKAVNIIGSGLYHLGMSLLMPIFLYMVVSQKEERQIQIMKMNGLDGKHYWVNFFIVSFILSMITSLNMYVLGTWVINITFFKQTSFMLLLITFVGWAIAMISLTSFVQIFINNSKTATIVGYLLSIFSTIVGGAITTVIFPLPMRMPSYLLIYPPFALARIIYYMGWSCSDVAGCYQSVFGLQGDLILAIVLLYLWFLVYLLSIWLNDMVQQEYGVAKYPYLIQKCIKMCKREEKGEFLLEETYAARGAHDANEVELSDMQNQLLNRKDDLVDESVIRHREEVLSASNNHALVIRDLSKKYLLDNGQKNKVALKPLTMVMKKGQILGFLGPNGAGKTTLISVLTGMYPQTSGKAWIGGREIGHPSTNQMVGVCPQFDILWGSLTVEEHIRFYCKLKQVDSEAIQARVEELLKEVDLVKERAYFIGQLSGGMQRRVSIACALSGNPSIVILDQPTSGLDPYHRRQIWKILQKCKKRTSIFMTSHLMDEVEFLCDRIVIISQGQMRCIGDLPSLKEKFGLGYRLTISYPAILREQEAVCPIVVQDLIRKLKLQVVSQLETRVVLKIEKKDMRQCIQKLKKESQLDWFINQPSLYDVFMHFVK